MRPRTAASAALLLGLLATAAPGQPPPKDVPQPMPPKKADPKSVGQSELVVSTAEVNDPAVRIAQAKLELAQAELAQARYAATVRVAVLKGRLDVARSAVEFEEKRYRLAEALRANGRGLESEMNVVEARDRLTKAKAELAGVEAEWKLLTEGPKRSPVPTTYRDKDGVERSLLTFLTAPDAHQSTLNALEASWLMAHDRARGPAVKGPIPDRLRAALDKPVSLGAKGEVVTFAKAMEVFAKEAGLDVPARGAPLAARPDLYDKGQLKVDPVTGKVLYVRVEIVTRGETLPVGAWLQVFQDECGFTLYVREYGLLAATRQTAPPDAPTLVEFWKQKPAGARGETAPEPKPK